MCRRTEEEVGPTVGLPRHRHFVGFFNMPVQAPTRDHPFYTVIPTHRPNSSPFTITLGIRRTHSRLNPPGPHGEKKHEKFEMHLHFKNKTYPMSSNSHPLTVANKARHCLKLGGGSYKTNGDIIQP